MLHYMMSIYILRLTMTVCYDGVKMLTFMRDIILVMAQSVMKKMSS